MDLPASLAEQLPVAVLFLVAAAAVAPIRGNRAARLLDRLIAAQQQLQARLIDALERNTAAWRDTCAALRSTAPEAVASLEAAVQALAARRPRPAAGNGHGPACPTGPASPGRDRRPSSARLRGVPNAQ